MISVFKKIAVLIVTIIAVPACARPKYETVVKDPSSQGETGSAQEKASSCSIKFKKSGNCLSWQWEQMPTSTVAGSLVFKIYRAHLYDDTLVLTDPEIQPQVILWMPSMGHGSSPTTVTQLDVGSFRAANVFFVMPGDWEIRFQIKDGSNVLDEAVVSISI